MFSIHPAVCLMSIAGELTHPMEKDRSLAKIGAVMAFTACVAAFSIAGQAAENFERLSGQQIEPKFSGMELTDEVHWGEVYSPNGTLTIYSMGRKSVGKWHVQGNELCLDQKEDSGCYEVWMSGKNVELRRAGSSIAARRRAASDLPTANSDYRAHPPRPSCLRSVRRLEMSLIAQGTIPDPAAAGSSFDQGAFEP